MDVKARKHYLGTIMISPTAEYALRAVVALAQAHPDALVTADMAVTTKVPPGYLPKVLQTLRRAGLVESKRGLKGGFTLSKLPRDISVLSVINAIDPLKRIERCPLGLANHGTSLCPLHRRLDEAIAIAERSFAGTSIADLLGAPSGRGPLCSINPVSQNPLSIAVPAEFD
jgi:Rrf2 family protein